MWPYGQIGDASARYALAKRTYANHPHRDINDWNNDPLQAVRLGLGGEVASTLTPLIEKHQTLRSGLATFFGNEPYVEQQGVTAAALSKALVQDYDGVLRIAAALPPGWDASSTAFIHGGSKVSVQAYGGTITTMGITAGSTGGIAVGNPWPAQQVEVSTAVTRAPSWYPPPAQPHSQSPRSAAEPTWFTRCPCRVSAESYSQVTGNAASARAGLERPARHWPPG
ncbi:hypothetical protein AB0M29_31165 [Streptomyces sp. NPDC051976]|uniref:hypothetical protein n=1 Tax=Streptomyces sp. NPDC051976 TaxID=3154947 RepID=UPI003444EB69